MPRRLMALGLVAWLGGLGCVLGCAATASHAAGASPAHAAKTAESHSTAETDSCAAMRAHDCCRAVAEDGDGRASAGAEKGPGRAAMHCPLGGRHASDPARKIRVDNTPPASTPATQSPAPEVNYAPPASAARVRVPDRGSTHLRCCVFLI